MKNKTSIEQVEQQLKDGTLLDITAPETVVIEINIKRRALYVHIDGITVLRCCRVKTFIDAETNTVL